jgi:hypothetical protein
MAFQKTLAMLLQFLMFTLVTAAPVMVETTKGNAWQYGAGGGIVGFIVLILDIIVFSTFPAVSFSLDLLKQLQPQLALAPLPYTSCLILVPMSLNWTLT